MPRFYFTPLLGSHPQPWVHVSEISELTPAERLALQRPLAFDYHFWEFAGGRAQHILMQGEYVVTYNVSALTLPPIDASGGYIVRTHLYCLVDAPALWRPYSHNPVPDATLVNRIRILRFSRPPILNWEGVGDTIALTIPEPLKVVAIRGEVRAYSTQGFFGAGKEFEDQYGYTSGGSGID